MIVTITQSEMKALDMCPKKWWFRYNEKLDSKRPRRALDVGTAAHNGIEMFYKYPSMGIKDIVKNILEMYDRDLKRFLEVGGYPPDDEEIAEDRILIESMIRLYADYAAKNDKFKVISMEEEFNLPIIDPTGNIHENLRFMGKVDAIAILNNCHFLVEHKTMSRLERDYWWPHLNQIDAYTYAMQRKMGVKFYGAIFNVLVKKLPSKPKLLKGGKRISKTLGDTTEELFTRVVEEYGLNVDDYLDILTSIRAKGNPFVKREMIFRNEDNIKETELKIWHAMQRKINLGFFPKNKTDKCNYMCGYKDLCIDDQQLIRDALYYVREKEHSELEDDGSSKDDSI